MTTRANKILESLNKRNRKLLKESKSVSEHEIGKLHDLEESEFGYGYEIPYDKIDSVIEPGKILTELKKAVENGMKLVVCDSMYKKDGGVPVDGKNRVLLNQGTLILDDIWYVGLPESLKSNVIELEDEPNFKTYTTHVPCGSTTASWDDEVLTTDTKDIIKNYDLFKFEDNAWEKAYAKKLQI